jgi:hypothetical protein
MYYMAVLQINANAKEKENRERELAEVKLS